MSFRMAGRYWAEKVAKSLTRASSPYDKKRTSRDANSKFQPADPDMSAVPGERVIRYAAADECVQACGQSRYRRRRRWR